MSAITSDWKLSETATSTERSVRSGKSNSRTEDFLSALDSYIAGYWRHLAVIAPTRVVAWATPISPSSEGSRRDFGVELHGSSMSTRNGEPWRDGEGNRLPSDAERTWHGHREHRDRPDSESHVGSGPVPKAHVRSHPR